MRRLAIIFLFFISFFLTRDCLSADMLSPRLSINSNDLLWEKIFTQESRSQDMLLKSVVSTKGFIPEDPIPRTNGKERISVLILCNHNQERSVMAEKLLLEKMPEEIKGFFDIRSAGIRLTKVHSPRVSMALEQHRLLRNRAPQQVTESQLKGAKIIFVMTRRQREKLITNDPSLNGKVFLFLGDEVEGLHTVNDDYNGRLTYRPLEKKVSSRIPAIIKHLRLVLAEELDRSRPQKAESISADNTQFINNSI